MSYSDFRVPVIQSVIYKRLYVTQTPGGVVSTRLDWTTPLWR